MKAMQRCYCCSKEKRLHAAPFGTSCNRFRVNIYELKVCTNWSSKLLCKVHVVVNYKCLCNWNNACQYNQTYYHHNCVILSLFIIVNHCVILLSCSSLVCVLMFFMRNSARELLHGVHLVVYNYCLNYGCAANCKNKSKNHHNTNPFFKFVILILLPIYRLNAYWPWAFLQPFRFYMCKDNAFCVRTQAFIRLFYCLSYIYWYASTVVVNLQHFGNCFAIIGIKQAIKTMTDV